MFNILVIRFFLGVILFILLFVIRFLFLCMRVFIWILWFGVILMIFLFRLILINVFIEELIYFLSLFNKEYFLLGDLFENFLF